MLCFQSLEAGCFANLLRALGLEYHVPPGAFRLGPEEHW